MRPVREFGSNVFGFVGLGFSVRMVHLSVMRADLTGRTSAPSGGVEGVPEVGRVDRLLPEPKPGSGNKFKRNIR